MCVVCGERPSEQTRGSCTVCGWRNAKGKKKGLDVDCGKRHEWLANGESRVQFLGFADGLVPRIQSVGIGVHQVRLPVFCCGAKDGDVRVLLFDVSQYEGSEGGCVL